MLSVVHYAECHYAECHYAECPYAECRYADCRGATVDHFIFCCSNQIFEINKTKKETFIGQLR
jgi:hypothetical protein